MSKYTKEEGHVGCEEDDKCLFCFPIEIGVKIIAVLSILGAVFQCVLVVEALSNFILLVFIGASAFFGVVSGILYLKFLMGDDQENRDNLQVIQKLKKLEESAKNDINVMPDIISCIENDCTLGEISDSIRNVFGEY